MLQGKSRVQQTYILGSTLFASATLIPVLGLAFRQPPTLFQALQIGALTIAHGILGALQEEFQTPTEKSPVFFEISDVTRISALCLCGPIAAPFLLLADAVSRWWDLRWWKPLGYVLNFAQATTNMVVFLAAMQILTQGEIARLSQFPSGTLATLALIVFYIVFSTANHAVLLSFGIKAPVLSVLRGVMRPALLITMIPPAMGLLISVMAVTTPGLVIPMLIPILLSQVAMRAVARWVESHNTLEQKVAEQTAAIRAHATQLAELEERRHHHTTVLVHDLQKEFQVGDRFTHQMLHALGASPEPSLGPIVGQISAVFGRAWAMSEDILIGSKLRAGEVSLKPQSVNGTELVASVVGRYLLTAAQHNVVLTMDCDEMLSFTADPAQLDRALANLIQNAIEYTKAGERRIVTVSISSLPEHAVIAVSDTGCGIEAADLERIGQRFVRLAQGTEHHHGNGIGLFGVAMIVELHHGSITITSPGRGQGTTVTLNIPYAPTHPAVDEQPALSPMTLTADGYTT